MKVLGIRVEPKKTTFVVLEREGEHCSFINQECIKIPAALDFPEKLKYLRNCILDILREYSISVAGIRVAEGSAQNLDITRLHIEGVVQEAFSSSEVSNYFVGRKASIAARLGLNQTELGLIIKGDKEFGGMTNWEKLKNPCAREAALVAMGAIK